MTMIFFILQSSPVDIFVFSPTIRIMKLFVNSLYIFSGIHIRLFCKCEMLGVFITKEMSYTFNRSMSYDNILRNMSIFEGVVIKSVGRFTCHLHRISYDKTRHRDVALFGEQILKNNIRVYK